METKTVSTPAPKQPKLKQFKKLHRISTIRRNPIKRRKVYPRGVVYLGHIPHGFYEEQMTDYFKQFGEITRVRVARSKNVSICIISNANIYLNSKFRHIKF